MFGYEDINDWDYNTYQYQNGQYVLVKQIISTSMTPGSTSTAVTVSTYGLESGKMELINSTTTELSASSSSTNDVNFTGIITAVQDSRDVDGDLSIEVDNKWIDIDNAGLSINAPTPGSVTGLDLEANTQTYIGKKVEVFAAAEPSNSNYLSITGDAKYYVKVVQ
jgi:hypothetical protein